MAGEGGIYAYNPQLHAWTQYSDKRVTSVLPKPVTDENEAEDGLYFGYLGGVGLLTPSMREPETWVVGNHQIIKLVAGPDNKIFAFSAEGEVYALGQDENGTSVDWAFALGENTLDPAQFSSALAFGDIVLFLGPEGILLHNIVSRHYETIPSADLPTWLSQPGLQAIQTGQAAYILVSNDDETDIYPLVTNQLTNGATLIDALTALSPISVLGQVSSTWPWQGDDIGVLNTAGGVYRVTREGQTRLLGALPSILTGQPLLDVVQERDGDLMVSTESGLASYDVENRIWHRVVDFPADDWIVEMTNFQDNILLRTNRNRLAQVSNDTPVLVGDATGFTISEVGLSDVLGTETDLYLAGEGHIEQYSLSARRIIASWYLEGSGPVRLLDLLGTAAREPMALTQNKLFIGNRSVDERAGAVRNASLSQSSLWTVRELNGQRYLKHYNIRGAKLRLENPTCFFRQPYMRANTILDARSLPDNNIAIATEQGLRFYSPSARSWYAGPADLLTNQGRLYRLGDYLLLSNLEPDGLRLSFLPVDSIVLPDSCATGTVSVGGGTITVKTAAVDEANGRVSWLTKNGAVGEWQNGETRLLVSAPIAGPVTANLRQVYATQGSNQLWFTTLDGLWQYNLASQQWTNFDVQFTQPITAITAMDLSFDEDGTWLVAQTSTGSYHLGLVNLSQASVNMNPLYQPPANYFNATATDLLDVQNRGQNMWGFILQDRLKYYDSARRAWEPDVTFAGGDIIQSFTEMANRGVVIAQTSTGDTRWWVAADTSNTPTQFIAYEPVAGEKTALDRLGNIWRLTPEGLLWKCEAVAGAYQCLQQNNPPFRLNPDAVQRAFIWDKYTLFATETGLRLVETSTSQELALPSEASTFSGAVLVRSIGGSLYVYSPDSTVALHPAGQNFQATLHPAEPWPVFLVRAGEVLAGLALVLGVLYLLALIIIAFRVRQYLMRGLMAGALALLLVLLGFGLAQIWLAFNIVHSNVWFSLRRQIVETSTGQSIYNPIMRFNTNEQGRLLAVQASGERALGVTGSAVLNTPPALDAGWLSWDRASDSFRLRAGFSSRLIPKADFISQNHLLFEPVEALIRVSAQEFRVANEHGFWFYPDPSLNLNEPNVTFEARQLTLPIQAVQGQFSTPNGVWTATGSESTASAGQVTVGAVTFRQSQNTLTATITVLGQSQPAFSKRGFVWDTGRRGIAYQNGQIILQTDAGLHPAQSLANFDPGPDKLAVQGGQLYYEGDQIYLAQGDKWTRFQPSPWYWPGPGSWEADVLDPIANRLMLTNYRWQWDMQVDQIAITLPDESHQFALSQGPDGLAFNADLLQDAVLHNGDLYVMSQAFMEVMEFLDQLRLGQGQRFAPQPTESLRSFGEGESGLYRYQQGQAFAWTDEAWQVVSTADDPTQNQTLLETERLRFTRAGGQINMTLQAENFDGNSAWFPFNFVQNNFPFDVVTALASFDDGLYLGTAAGLQVYPSQTDLSLNAAENLYQPSASGAALQGVRRLGSPVENDSLFFAHFQNPPAASVLCFSRSDASTDFGPCALDSNLDWRLRVETDFWRWQQNQNGGIAGQYKLVEGQTSQSPAPDKAIFFTQGRFVHDVPADVTVCQNRAFSLWREDWVSVYPNTRLNLSLGIRNYAFTGRNPKRLICLEGNLLGPNSAGLYVEGDDKQVWHYRSGQWPKVENEALVSRVLAAANNPPVLLRDGLRLLAPLADLDTQADKASLADRGFVFEQRTNEGHWLPLPWVDGVVGLDKWQDIIYHAGRFWAATPVGLVAFSQNSQGHLLLDVAQMTVVRPPAEAGGCSITDLRVENDVVLSRCNNEQGAVYQSQLTLGDDEGRFQKYAGADPFYEQVFVSAEQSGYWDWRFTGHEGDNAGQMVAQLHGEAIQLTGGRFAFDTLNSLALFQADMVELGTDVGGWYQSSRTDFHLKNWGRPNRIDIAPTEVTALKLTKVNDENRLCLHTFNGDYVRLSPTISGDEPERLGQCFAYLGDDVLWRYAQDEDSLVAQARQSEGGSVLRFMENGRFRDDVLLSLPTTGVDKAGIFYLLPTAGGVLRLNTDLSPTLVHAPPFTGLAPQVSPSALFMQDAETAVYFGQDGFYTLDENRISANLGSGIPVGATMLAVEDGPQNMVRLWWEQNGERHWYLAQREDFSPTMEDSFFLGLSNLDSYLERQLRWDNPIPWLELSFAPGTVSGQWFQGAEAYQLPVPAVTKLVKPIVVEEQLYLVGQRELLEVDLEPLLEGAFALRVAEQ